MSLFDVLANVLGVVGAVVYLAWRDRRNRRQFDAAWSGFFKDIGEPDPRGEK